MPKRVLGNDPFLKGAPEREPVASSEPPQAPSSPTPILIPLAQRAVEAPAAPAAERQKVAPKPVVPRPKPRANAGTSSKAPAGATTAAGASRPSQPFPGARPPTQERPPAQAAPAGASRPPSQPSPVARPLTQERPPAQVAPTQAAPPQAAPPQAAPTGASAAAPSVVGAAPRQPVAHAASPSAGADPIAHAGSPTAGADPVAHAASPSLPADPVAHAASPDSGPDPVPHAGSPRLLTAAEGRSAPATGRAPSPLRRVAKGLLSAATTALGARAPAQTDAWGKDPELVRNLAPVAQFLYQQYWRVTVSGAAHLPTGPCVIVANHAGALPLDGPVLHAAIHRERPELPDARWLLEDAVFYSPFLGVLLQRLGGVRANPENAHRLLGEGRPVIVFPEGVQGLSRPAGERYALKRFGRGGYVKLALKASVPIIPVAIVGAQETSPQLAQVPAGLLGMAWLPLTTVPLPARWSIAFGAPVTVDSEGSGDDLAWIQGVNDQVRDTISGLLTTLLRERTSVYR